MWFFVGRLSRWPAGSIGWPKPGFESLGSRRPGFGSWAVVSSLPSLLSPVFSTAVFDSFFLNGGLFPQGLETHRSPFIHFLRVVIDYAASAFYLSETRLRKVCLFGKLRRIFPRLWKNGCGYREGMQRLGRALPAHHERHEGKNKMKSLFWLSSSGFPNLSIIWNSVT